MLPEARYYRPEEKLSWLIKQFEFITYNGKEALTDKFVPREDVSIVFHFRNRPRMVSPIDQTLPPVFIAPLTPTANSICLPGGIDSMIITCRPTVLSRFLGISLAPRKDIWVPAPEKLLSPVWQEMSHGGSDAARMDIFSSFISSNWRHRYIPDETDRSYDLIIRKGINTTLHDITDELQVSERTLQRRFRDRLGATPKMLIRLIRINFLWETTSKGGNIDYQDMVFLGSYFDQTHMIKDFKSITGETPRAFFRRNLSMARIFSGK